MASYHLSVKTVSRATGRSGPGAAAYRTASRIVCERDGTTHDYTRRSGVEASFIVAPSGAEWAQDRAVLWNAVEAAEKRRDAKVAREYELALPHELAPGDRHALAAGFARAVVARFGVAADVAIHAPGREGDQRNWHAHVLTTTRAVTAEGLGAKTRELDVIQTSGPAVEALRELWAVQVNQALERIQAEARVDHRSLTRQGEDRAPMQHLGPAAAGMERKAARQAQEPTQEAVRAVPTAAETQNREAAQEAQKRPGKAVERDEADGMGVPPSLPLEAPVRASAGVCGAGVEPVTRIGQRNAEIQAGNRAIEAARRAVELARRAVDELGRAAAAGRRWMVGLAQGVGAQLAGEREQRAREAERQRQAQELAQQEAARAAELERQRSMKPAPIDHPSQAQRDEARRQLWGRVEQAGRQARGLALDADRAQQRNSEAPRPRGPSMRR